MSPKLTDDRKEQRNRQILEAAEQVFIRKGYSAASLKDIIEETGMSRGWIYLYYSTKEEIFEALLDHRDIEYEKELGRRITDSPTVWPVIRNLYEQQLDDLERHGGGMMPAFYEYFLVGWRDPQRSELLERRYDQGVSRFENLLRIGVERGEFTPAMDTLDIAKLVSSLQEGIVTHAITIGVEKTNARMQFDALLRYLHDLLLGRTAR